MSNKDTTDSMSFLGGINDEKMKQIFNACLTCKITRPNVLLKTTETTSNSPPLSLVMDTDRDFPDDMQLCQNHRTIWYMTSEDAIQTAGSSDLSYHSGSDPLEFVKTLKTAPLTTAQKSPPKLPKMSLKINVGQVPPLHRKDLVTLNSRQ